MRISVNKAAEAHSEDLRENHRQKAEGDCCSRPHEVWI